eukprot:11045872-Lingulodinium_polyedra.AAC.1
MKAPVPRFQSAIQRRGRRKQERGTAAAAVGRLQAARRELERAGAAFEEAEAGARRAAGTVAPEAPTQ